MKIRWESLTLDLEHRFTIARSSKIQSATLVMHLEHAGTVGIGECCPTSRYGETLQSVEKWLSQNFRPQSSPLEIEELLSNTPPSVRCALDISYHDWLTKYLGVPLWRYLNADPAHCPPTSYTLGIDTVDAMLAKLEAVRDYPIIKVKLGTPYDYEILESIRSRYTGILRIDANEGWTAQQCVDRLKEFERFDLEFCEQPIPAGSPEQLRWIRERIKIPLIADEDAKNAADVLALRDCVDGVNIKLVKTGGIRGALDMIRAARALNMRVMLGCMIESSILVTAAAHLSPLVDWADLDSPLLVTNDPYTGITYNGGIFTLPTSPGLGVLPRYTTEGVAL